MQTLSISDCTEEEAFLVTKAAAIMLKDFLRSRMNRVQS